MSAEIVKCCVCGKEIPKDETVGTFFIGSGDAEYICIDCYYAEMSKEVPDEGD